MINREPINLKKHCKSIANCTNNIIVRGICIYRVSQKQTHVTNGKAVLISVRDLYNLCCCLSESGKKIQLVVYKIQCIP